MSWFLNNVTADIMLCEVIANQTPLIACIEKFLQNCSYINKDTLDSITRLVSSLAKS